MILDVTQVGDYENSHSKSKNGFKEEPRIKSGIIQRLMNGRMNPRITYYRTWVLIASLPPPQFSSLVIVAN